MKVAVRCLHECDKKTCYHGVRLYGTDEYYCTFFRWDNDKGRPVSVCEDRGGKFHQEET